MPEISLFFGIIIRMFVEPDTSHHRSLFHAYYQDDVAIYSVESLEMIAGHLPRRQQRLVEAWAELHLNELIENWERLQQGEAPIKIDPLK